MHKAEFVNTTYVPSTPTPSTNTSQLHSLTGAFLVDFTTRNPACWKKCLRKAYRANRDASELPVDTQDPPFKRGQNNNTKVKQNLNKKRNKAKVVLRKYQKFSSPMGRPRHHDEPPCMDNNYSIVENLMRNLNLAHV